MYTYSLNPKTRERLLKILSYILPAVGVFGIGILYILGQYSFLLLSLYLAIPLALSPAFFYLANQKAEINKSSEVIPKRLLISIYALCLGCGIFWGRFSPRPRIFFVLFAISLVCILLYILQYGEISLPLIASSINAVAFHLSTTTTNALYIGSGDASAQWINVMNSLADKRLLLSGGYQDFPNLFSNIVIVGEMTGLNGRSAMFVFGAATMGMALWFIVFFCYQLRIIPTAYLAIPAVILSISYNYYYVGLSSLPRSTFSQLAILAMAIVLGLLINENTEAIERYLIALTIILTSLLFYHKVGQIWLLGIITLYVLIHVSVNGSLDLPARFPKFLLFGGFLVAYLFLMIESGVITSIISILRLFRGIGSNPTSGGLSLILSDPTGVFFTLIDSSLVLSLFLVGSFYCYRFGKTNQTIFSIVAMMVAPFYFPGIGQFLFAEFGIGRLTKFALPFIVVISSLGLLVAWTRSSPKFRVVLLLLILVGGTLVYSNDIYSRDNPIKNSGTFTNYFTESEIAAMEFGLEHTDRISSDRQGYSYMIDRKVRSQGWGGKISTTPIILASPSEICHTSFLFRGSEVSRRGAVIIPFADGIQGAQWSGRNVTNIRITSLRELGVYKNRANLYTNGNDVIAKC